MPMTCKSCKRIYKKYHPAARFCSACGGELDKEPDSRSCNWCYSPVHYDYQYCNGCGRSRHDALETKPSPKVQSRKSKLFWTLATIFAVVLSLAMIVYEAQKGSRGWVTTYFVAFMLSLVMLVFVLWCNGRESRGKQSRSDHESEKGDKL